jgi:GT2 family glycosyltransferase
MRLSVAIVLYRSDPQVVDRTLASLAKAVMRAGIKTSLWLIDNDDDPSSQAATRLGAQFADPAGSVFERIEVLKGHGNLGFGRGHNLVLDALDSDLHLILNPDAMMSEDTLLFGIEFLSQNPDVILIAPSAYHEDGQMQFLCRRYPALLDLLLRGFAPKLLRRLFRRRLDHYEMRDLIGAHEVVFNPLILSGSFMLFRTGSWQQLKGFSPAYFLYFEDYDLSLRSHALGKTAYVPAMRIVHLGGDAAKKGFGHIRMFLSSARIFFGQHGWKLF